MLSICFLHTGCTEGHEKWRCGLPLTFSESKVLAKPDNEENMKEESTPPYAMQTRSNIGSSLPGKVNCQILLPECRCLRVCTKMSAAPPALKPRLGIGKDRKNSFGLQRLPPFFAHSPFIFLRYMGVFMQKYTFRGKRRLRILV